MKSHKGLFSRFLATRPHRLHFAAHSHHLWPDVTRDAHVAAWDDAARLIDGKWDHVFGEIVPRAQRHVARLLNLTDPGQIAFAPNTHEFVARLLSCLKTRPPAKVVTTDSEFMSFTRQIARSAEAGQVEVVRVPAEPFETFEARFADTVIEEKPDLVFFSHVFFNSGVIVRELPRIVAAAPKDALVVVDGYHAFLAVPTDLWALEERAFYLGGGYKYAMTGEGACFLHVPKQTAATPVNTGWFASFGDLTQGGLSGAAPFSRDGYRFFGATFDPSALYRFNAVCDLLESEQLDVAGIHARVRALQTRFVELLASRGDEVAPRASDLIVPASQLDRLGHFLTFVREDASEIETRLAARDIVVDYRGNRLRFGFGLYHDEDDLLALVDRLAM
jgi:selenocysteine lyase/cysteine desulfurase